MLGLALTFWRRGGAADPTQIFGANLMAWYDASVGVTSDGGVPDRITQWNEQSPAANFASEAAPNGPKYIVADTDGTPSVWFDPAENSASPARPRLLFNAGLLITPETTVYAFVNIPATVTNPKIVITGTGSAVAQLGVSAFSGVNVDRPGITENSIWFVPAGASLSGWALVRFGGSNANTLRSIARNADAQNTAAGSWIGTSPNWASMSAPANNRHLSSSVKQIIITNTFVQDADAVHQQVLDYIKARYPTLVTY